MSDQPRHIPVLLDEVLEALNVREGGHYIDATLGAGGYSRAILSKAQCRVWGFDRDPSAQSVSESLSLEFSERFSWTNAPFAKLTSLETSPDGNAIEGVLDGVVFDLGVSSMQLDEADRGFSFQSDGPLDMRMFSAPGFEASETGLSAADVVNSFSAEKLADIFYIYGDEKRSRAIARAILEVRDDKPFVRTKQLADCVERVLGGRRGSPKHPATRVFQALRIYVNDELGELIKGLSGAERCLKPGGRLVVVAFHSLEDRIVKRFFRQRAGKDIQQSRHLPEQEPAHPASFQIVNQRGLTSTKNEINANPRARSAVLRSGIRTEAPVWPLDDTTVGNARLDKR